MGGPFRSSLIRRTKSPCTSDHHFVGQHDHLLALPIITSSDNMTTSLPFRSSSLRRITSFRSFHSVNYSSRTDRFQRQRSSTLFRKKRLGFLLSALCPSQSRLLLVQHNYDKTSVVLSAAPKNLGFLQHIERGTRSAGVLKLTTIRNPCLR